MPTLKKVPAYQDGDGVLHASIQLWQAAEMQTLLRPMMERVWPDNSVTVRLDLLAKELIGQSESLLSILTTGPTSRPGARKRAGTTAPKRAAKRATEAQVVSGIKAMREAVEAAPQATEQAA